MGKRHLRQRKPSWDETSAAGETALIQKLAISRVTVLGHTMQGKLQNTNDHTGRKLNGVELGCSDVTSGQRQRLTSAILGRDISCGILYRSRCGSRCPGHRTTYETQSCIQALDSNHNAQAIQQQFVLINNANICPHPANTLS